MAEDQTARSGGAGYLFGAAILAVIFCQIGSETTGFVAFGVVGAFCLLVVIALIAVRARGAGRLFLLASVALTAANIAWNPAWRESLWNALDSAGFFIAFFSALTGLRNAAGSSPGIAAAGAYLARQPPGRRYFALTAGAQAFTILLNYGAISLLGALAMASAETEPDERIRAIRTRRMLQAIHRGFVSALTWSPLSFSIAISVAVIPGTSWSQMAVPGAVSSVIILGVGWALDTIFKPRPAGGPPRPQAPAGRWTALSPLALLLLLMLTLLLALEAVLPIRVIGLVLMIVPALSLGWIVIQSGGVAGLSGRFGAYLRVELPSYRNEILLIATAGYIGASASVLVAPRMAETGFDLSVVPAWLLLPALVWIMPILGQFGANPILSLSLIGPLLPPAESLGVSPTALAAALVCGWAMTGASSPFTANVLLIGRFGGIRPVEVGWVWNRVYFPVTIGLLCAWILIYAHAIG